MVPFPACASDDGGLWNGWMEYEGNLTLYFRNSQISCYSFKVICQSSFSFSMTLFIWTTSSIQILEFQSNADDHGHDVTASFHCTSITRLDIDNVWKVEKLRMQWYTNLKSWNFIGNKNYKNVWDVGTWRYIKLVRGYMVPLLFSAKDMVSMISISGFNSVHHRTVFPLCVTWFD